MNLRFENISKSYNGKFVFEDLSGEIHNGDKIGLVGANGAGKTTLVRILMGLENCDSGSVRPFSPDAGILYIEQYPVYSEGQTVYQELKQSALKSGSVKDNVDETVQKALYETGIPRTLWDREAAHLSGGEKTKLSLSKILAGSYDMLVLDEPTNHLDMESCEWLERVLKSMDKTMLIISHDRFLLDSTVKKIWELTPDGLKAYSGNYTSYKLQKENELKNDLTEFNKQQVQIRALKKMIVERKNWSDSAHKAAGQNDFLRAKAKKHTSVMKAKQRQLERLEENRMDKPRKAVSPAFGVINKNVVHEKLPPNLIQVTNLSKSFDSKVFDNVSFTLMRGDKIALIGRNGAGKTSLLKIVTGQDSGYEGEVFINPSVKIGYFAQELDNLKHESSILDDVLVRGTTVEEARLLLACLLFRGDDVYKKIADLSMGEKCRVAFAKLILSGANLLVMDEPTNYMDIISREKIEEVLDDFKGSILFVSHDRYLVKRIANKILLIRDHSLKCYEGGYGYYLDKTTEEHRSKRIGADYNGITDNIRRLENELAFLGGKLDTTREEEQKELLTRKFLETAKELNSWKEKLAARH